MNELAVSAMWMDASADLEAEEHRSLVVSAKVALAGSWPFLAAATSEPEFEARLALMRESIEHETPPEALSDVLASLRQDYAELATMRSQEATQLRQAALSVTASKTAPAYLHMHHHGAGEEAYWQLDHVVAPTLVATMARHGSRDDVLAYALQQAASLNLPVFEDGKHVSGEIIPKLARSEEFFDRASGSWIKVATGGDEDEGDDEESDRGNDHEQRVASEYAQFSRRPDWELNNIHRALNMMPYLNGPQENARLDAVKRIKKERRKHGVYTPDPTDALRYSAYPPITDFPSQGGSPLAPVSQTGPDGFPPDYAEGEQRTPEAYARQTTPGTWAVPPDGGWRDETLPNAATGLPQGQYPGPGWPRSAAAGDIIPTPHVRVDPRPDKGRYDVNYVSSPMSMQTLLRTHDENEARNRAAEFAQEHGILHHTGSKDDPNDLTQSGHRPFPYTYTPSEHEAYGIGKDHFHAGEPYSAYKVPDIVNQSPEHQMYTRGWMGHPKDHAGPQREMERRWNSGTGKHEPITSARTASNHVTRYVSWANEHGHDPDEVSSLKAYEQEPGIGRSHTNRIADELYIGGGESDWRKNSSLTHRAGEGVAGVPGPNPNYFSQGTQGLQGPPTFPEDPAAEPTPPDQINPMVTTYGGVPPEHSTGTATTGTEDGGGYTRQAAAIPKGRQLCSNCDGTGTVGTTSNEGEHDCPQCGGKGHVKMGSRQYLGTLVHVGEYQYVHKQGDKWVITQKGTGKVLSHHDSEEDAQASFRAMMQSKHSGSRAPGQQPDFPQSARERTAASGPYQSRGEQGEHYGDPQYNPPIGPEGEDSDCNCHTDRENRQIVVNPLCPVHGHYAKEARRAQSGQHANDYYDGREHGMAGYPLTHFDTQPSRGYIEGHEQGEYERGHMSDPEREEHDDYYHRWNQNGPRTASTSGQIVGHCDNCHSPVRWHDGENGSNYGHLEHLHNGSHKCNDGSSSNTARTAGLTVLPQFFDPSLLRAQASGDLAVQPAQDNPAQAAPMAPGMDPAQNQDTSAQGGMGGGVGTSNVPQASQSSPSRLSSHIHPIGAQTLTAPTPENPTGRDPDEFRAQRAWEGLIHQRPMQSAEQRNINTPSLPSDSPIPSGAHVNTPTPGLGDESGSVRNDDDLEEEERD